MAVVATLIQTVRAAVIFLASLVVLPQKLDSGLAIVVVPLGYALQVVFNGDCW